MPLALEATFEHLLWSYGEASGGGRPSRFVVLFSAAMLSERWGWVRRSVLAVDVFDGVPVVFPEEVVQEDPGRPAPSRAIVEVRVEGGSGSAQYGGRYFIVGEVLRDA